MLFVKDRHITISNFSSAMIRRLPSPIRGNPPQVKKLELAAKMGRGGADCTRLFSGCPASELRFMMEASKWASDHFIGREKARQMLEWAFLRERLSAASYDEHKFRQFIVQH